MGSKVQRFKGCVFITIRHFVNVLYGKTDRFHIPTNLPAIAELLGYCPFRTWQARQAGLEHGIWQLYGKTNILYEDFGSSILSLSLTLVYDSARPASLFWSNWQLWWPEAALNVEPWTCERLRNGYVLFCSVMILKRCYCPARHFCVWLFPELFELSNYFYPNVA